LVNKLASCGIENFAFKALIRAQSSSEGIGFEYELVEIGVNDMTAVGRIYFRFTIELVYQTASERLPQDKK